MSIWLCILALAHAKLPTEAEIFAGVVAQVDRDGDGRIDREEYARVGDPTEFPKIDLDGNGEIDATELAWSTRITPVVPGVAPAALALPTPTDPQRPIRLAAIGLSIGALGLLGGVLLRRSQGRRR